MFARKQYVDPLSHRGTLDADATDDAVQAARASYGDGWVELTLVPEHAVHWVIEERGGAAGASGG